MGPLLPRKQEGDRLGATHVNLLSQTTERFNQMFPGSHSMGRFPGGEGANFDRMQVRRAEVTDTADYFDDTELDTIQLMYYDFEESGDDKWKKDDPGDNAGDWPMDHLGVDYANGTKLIVYYDVQRGAWIPISSAVGGAKWIEGLVIDNQCPEGTLDIKVKGASAPEVSSLDEVIRATDWFELMDGWTATELQSMECKALAGWTWSYITEQYEWRLWMITGIDECNNVNDT